MPKYKKYKLQKKNDLNYRLGSTNETQNCRHCKYFHARWISHQNQPEARCEVMGLESGGEYAVRGYYTCDAQVSTYVPPEI